MDDVDWIDVQTLAEEGYEPACVVETSWKNLQIWVDLGPDPMTPAERLNSARHLAETAHGDLRATASIHYGRLAGFRNLKDKHFDKGLKWGWPFVLCRQSRGIVCSRAKEERDRARRKSRSRSPAAPACRSGGAFCAPGFRMSA